MNRSPRRSPREGVPVRGSTSFSRREALALAGAGLAAAACGRAGGEPDRELAEQVLAFTAPMEGSMPYRPPRSAEAAELVSALLALAATPADLAARRVLARHGFTVGTAADSAGRRFVVAASDSSTRRSWGLYAFPLDAPVRVLVEVPHPVADRDTEKVGLDLVAEIPGAALVEAGAHRRADDSRADVAHETSSLFHALVTRVATDRRIPQVQLHGFDEGGQDQDVEVVLSPGAAALTPIAEAAAGRLAEDGTEVCRVWAQECPDLAGRTNVQGVAAARAGLPFVHVELSEPLRSDRDRRAAVARALGLAAR